MTASCADGRDQEQSRRAAVERGRGRAHAGRAARGGRAVLRPVRGVGAAGVRGRWREAGGDVVADSAAEGAAEGAGGGGGGGSAGRERVGFTGKGRTGSTA